MYSALTAVLHCACKETVRYANDSGHGCRLHGDIPLMKGDSLRELSIENVSIERVRTCPEGVML